MTRIMKRSNMMSLSSSSSSKTSGGSNKSRMFVVATTIVALLLLVLLVKAHSAEDPARKTSRMQEVVVNEEGEVKTAGGTGTTTITSGQVASIPYYHCTSSSSSTSSTDGYSIVLLHGMAFTKEDWKTSGIMDMFCSAPGVSSVTALDVDVPATHTTLQTVLQGMRDTNLISKLPVSALVTPSASGSAIIDWMMSSSSSSNKDELASELQQYASTWIPVAANGLLRLQQQQQQGNAGGNSLIASLQPWPILAIYGDQDVAGKKSSELLVSNAKAQIQELPGRHPCYLDSPQPFVNVIVQFLQKTIS